MNKQLEQLKKLAVLQVTEFIKGFKRINNKPAQPRDFDAYMSGYIAGLTVPEDKKGKNSIQILVMENTEELVRHIEKSKAIKSIGVTGVIVEEMYLKKFK